ncbi:MAG TPA: hypothetical protein VLL48_11850, partial [Longimicrobiales bacterium]|nr:hypothetical protein [Longimicrobiales bacterium]
MSVALSGESANQPCSEPAVSGSGRFVTFVSAATNLWPVASAVDRVYLHDRLTGITTLVTRRPPDPAPAPPASVEAEVTPSAGPAVGPAIAEGADGVIVAYQTGASDLGVTDTNGADDVYVATAETLGAAASLRSFDTQSGVITDSTVGVDSDSVVAAAGGRAGIVAFESGVVMDYLAVIWDAEGGNALRFPNSLTPARDMALSPTTYCLIDGSGVLLVGDPATAPTDPFSGNAQPTGVQAEAVGAVGDRCVVEDDVGVLQIVLRTGSTTFSVVDTAEFVEDFQVGPDGVAFRTCEADAGADLNGDTDTDDCVMRFWRFSPPGTEPNLVDVNRSAVPCTFPGCDPFFEPYRVGPGIVSFVSLESQEVDSGGSGAVGSTCLPTSPPGVCDLTGDRDGDDAAIEIFSVASRRIQSFPVDPENPPEVEPFPTVADEGNSVLVVQLPAEVLGEDFESLPDEQLVTVIVGDADGDGTFDADGNEDARTSVGDLCAEVTNAEQVDADGDLLGANCDVV